MNKGTRDVSRGRAWAVEEVCGAYMQHVWEVIASLGKESVAVECGFIGKVGDGAVLSVDEQMSEDEFAAAVGSFACGLVVGRTRRFLSNLIGWPQSILRALGDADAQEVVSQLRQHYEDFLAFERAPDPTKEPQLLVARSIFQTGSTMQLVKARASSGWVPSHELWEHVAQRGLSLVGSQICEGMSNVQKNDKSVRV